jgi:hypothetical protein
VVARGGPQVLGDRHQLAPGVVQVAQRPAHLGALLAEPEDQVGLGDQSGRPGLAQHVEGPLVPERRPDPLEDARHRLDVVREYLGPGAEDLAELGRVGVEVGDQQLHAAPGEQRVDLSNGLGVQPGAAVGQVVAGHAGHRRVPQAHRDHRLGHPAGLVGVELGRPAGVDLAEVTAPRTLIAANEEGGLAVLPTFVDVGAAGLLADGVQTLPLNQPAQRGELRPHPCGHLDPRGLAFDRGLRVARLDAQHAATVGLD